MSHETESLAKKVGDVQVLHVGGRTVVWLRGDVDATLERELGEAVESIPAGAGEVVVDVAQMRFCDLTVARFLDLLTQRGCVTVRYPSLRSREFLRLTGLDRSVQIQAGAILGNLSRGRRELQNEQPGDVRVDESALRG